MPETETTLARWVINPRWAESHLLLSGPRERHNANTYGRTVCGRRVNVGAVTGEKKGAALFRCPICEKKEARRGCPETTPSPWWVSWCGAGTFEYHGPWWITGSDSEGRVTICAAVAADSQEGARRVIVEAHDSPLPPIEWRFAEPRPRNWEPFSERFPRAVWMRWPHPVEEGSGRG